MKYVVMGSRGRQVEVNAYRAQTGQVQSELESEMRRRRMKIPDRQKAI